MNAKIQSSFTLSEFERLALISRVNLSDGHARYDLTQQQRGILARALELFERCVTRHQSEVESEFLSRFFECAGQVDYHNRSSVFLTFSSSSAIKMAAQFCRMRGLHVYLIEPCFDNIVCLLKTEGVPVTAVSEHQLTDMKFFKRLLKPSAALWIVQPNNPTGFCLARQALCELIECVADCKSTIIVDFCFRFYADELKRWDQYRALADSGASFICFEDTGKTWSMADTKAGITVCSTDISDGIYRLHDQLLLNVSPFHLTLLTEFIRNTLTSGFESTIGRIVSANRQIVHDMVERGSVRHGPGQCENVPMELLELGNEISGISLWDNLRHRGIDILPAARYFWSDPLRGRQLFRIPLSRSTRDLENAVPVIEETIIRARRHDSA